MKFNYDELYDDGKVIQFAASAKKYSKEEVVALCTSEIYMSFGRLPTVDDVYEGACAYRCGYNDDGERVSGYMIVDKKSRGSFPVWVIDYNSLTERNKSPFCAFDE